MEKLLDYLAELGIEPIEGVTQTIVFDDAVIYLDKFDGVHSIYVELVDEVVMIADSLDEILGVDEIIAEQDEREIEAIDYEKEDWTEEFKYKAEPKTQAKQLVGGMLKSIVDELLDEYNDKMALYMMFGDQEYYERCQEILAELEKIKL